MIAAAFAPEPVIVRMSDFKSNEYANLVAGPRYEPDEENPMIGYRGASRYLSEEFVDCFAMECEALRHVRDEMGLTNVKIMIPFVRTVAEAKGVIDLLGEHGLVRGENDLQVVMMCEVPSNAVIPEQFLEHFDGFSIGSNDLTQLTLGVDRDSSLVAESFDERDPAVLELLKRAIKACRDLDKYVGICGQGPSDHPDLAEWLLQQGIESMSLNPDTVVDTWLRLAKVERTRLGQDDRLAARVADHHSWCVTTGGSSCLGVAACAPVLLDHHLVQLFHRGLRRRLVEGDLATLDQVHPVAGLQHVDVVVGDHDDGDVALLAQLLHEVEDHGSLLGAHGGQGLVEQDDVGLGRHRAGHCDGLPLAPGEPGHGYVEPRDVDADLVQCFAGEATHLLACEQGQRPGERARA